MAREGALAQVVGQVLGEVSWQDRCHPKGFPADRDGIRAGIAAVEDETREALEDWHRLKSLSLSEHEEPERWSAVRSELVQVAAVALRTLREMPTPCNCDGGVGPGHSLDCPANPGSLDLILPASTPQPADQQEGEHRD